MLLGYSSIHLLEIFPLEVAPLVDMLWLTPFGRLQFNLFMRCNFILQTILSCMDVLNINIYIDIDMSLALIHTLFYL